jgi:hypothetical protein
MSLYRCRWQVELLFKEWKSHNRLKGFVTGEKAIAEGLVWTSLLSLVMKRRVAQSVMTGKLSMLKASKNSTTWWLPLLEAVQGEIVNILLKIKNSFLPTKQILIGL